MLRVHLRVTQGREQVQGLQGRRVEAVEQQGQQPVDLGRPGQPDLSRRVQPGQSGRAQQQQGAAQRHLAQLHGHGVLGLGQGVPQLPLQQTESGRAAQPPKLQVRALPEQGALPAREDERRVGRGVREQPQPLGRQLRVVDVHRDLDPGHQPAQFRSGRRIARGLVTGLEDLLGEVLGFAMRPVEEQHPVRAGFEGAGRVPQQGALAHPGRPPQLHHSVPAQGVLQLFEVRLAAHWFALRPRDECDPFPAHRPGAFLGLEQVHGRTVGVDHHVVVARDHRSRRVAGYVDAVVAAHRRAVLIGVGAVRFPHEAVRLCHGPPLFPLMECDCAEPVPGEPSPWPLLLRNAVPRRAVEHVIAQLPLTPGGEVSESPGAQNRRTTVSANLLHTRPGAFRHGRFRCPGGLRAVRGRPGRSDGRDPPPVRCGSRWRSRPPGGTCAAPSARWVPPCRTGSRAPAG